MLPGAAQWLEEDVAAAIEFELGIGRSADRLESLLAEQPAGRAEGGAPRLTDGIFALARAAELAFATDRVETGLDICREIAETPPTSPMHFALFASAGTLAGTVRIQGLLPRGVVYGHDINTEWPIARRDHQRVWPWPVTSVDAVALGRRLLPAAVCTLSYTQISAQLEPRQSPLEGVQGGLSEGARAGILTSLEAEAAFDVSRVHQAELVQPPALGLLGLETAYRARLRLMRASLRWQRLEADGSLIDWALLTLWAAGALRGEAWFAKLSASTAEGDFLRDLAWRIVTIRKS